MSAEIRFEWDAEKVKNDERKHGVRFHDAILIFDDPFALSEQNQITDGEERWRTIGLAGGIAILLVAHTIRNEGSDEIVRVISARRATKRERQLYDENREDFPG